MGTPKSLDLTYTINRKSGRLELISLLEGFTSVSLLKEFTKEDKLLLNTGADLVKTSRGSYKLTSVFADNDPVGLYRNYEHVTGKDASIRKTR